MEYIVRFKKTRPDAFAPSYAHEGDSGMDLVALDGRQLFPGQPVIFDCGIAVELPVGYEAQVRARSSLASQSIITCGGLGTIDSGYRGPIKVSLMLCNPNGRWQVSRGDRIAQLVIAPVMRVEFVEANELSDTVRGTQGFGSSGR